MGFRSGIVTEWVWLQEGGAIGIVEGAVAAIRDRMSHYIGRLVGAI